MNLLITALLCTLAAPPDHWPGFLGAEATAVDPATIPMEWSSTENVAWTQPIAGYGQSSPVIWGNHVFVTSVGGEKKESLHVLCFDLTSGKQKWNQTSVSTFPEKSSVYISRAAPTPVVDENGVYAYFESGDVVAFSHSGEELWQRSLTKDYTAPTNNFGLSASPVQSDNRMFILIDDPESAYLVALEKASGKVTWKTDRTPRRSWSSPALLEIAGEPQVVCSSAGSVDGYSTTTGELLWSYDEVGGNTATTPVKGNDNGLLIAASPGRRGENSEMARKSNGLLTVTKVDGKYEPKFTWTTTKATPSWASPIVHQGYAYWVNRSGVVFCFNIETGENVYSERIPQSPWATPVALGDHIYLFGKSGATTILAAGPEFRIVAENDLWTEDSPPVNNLPKSEEEAGERQQAAEMFSRPTLYGVAVVNGSIILRTGSQLFCVRK